MNIGDRVVDSPYSTIKGTIVDFHSTGAVGVAFDDCTEDCDPHWYRAEELIRIQNGLDVMLELV